MRITISLAIFIAAIFLTTLFASAQCGPQWLPGLGINGISDNDIAMCAWDPDGAGPAPASLVFGGNFSVAGNIRANGVARWDGTEWHSFGTGLSGIRCFAVLPSGELIAGGIFGASGANSVSGIARWSGSEWLPIGSGIGGSSFSVNSMAVLKNGNLVVGGSFTKAGSQSISNLAVWNGSGWSALGNPTGPVFALCVLSSGDLIAMGPMGSVGGVATGHIARWNGIQWASVGSNLFNLQLVPTALAVSASDTIYVAGASNGINKVFQLVGNTWTQLVGNANGTIHAIQVSTDGQLFVAGQFDSIGNVAAKSMARWANGWKDVFSDVPVSSGTTIYRLFSEPGGSIVATGSFSRIGGIYANGIARLSGGSWTNVATGVAGSTICSAALPSGKIVVGGAFSSINGVPTRNIAMWDGFEWRSLGLGFDGKVSHVVFDDEGNIVAAGEMQRSSSDLSSRVRKWNGTGWSDLSQHWFDTGITKLAILKNGNPAISYGSWSGTYPLDGSVAVYDGAMWKGLGRGPVSAPYDFVELGNGDIIAVGEFRATGGVALPSVMRWNRSAWSVVGTGTENWGGVRSAIALGTDAFAVSTGQDIRAWDGVGWTQRGRTNGGAIRFTPFVEDKYFAFGAFTTIEGKITYGLALWNGSAWQSMGNGPGSGAVTSVSVVSEHQVVATGGVGTTGKWISRGLARWVDSSIPQIGGLPEAVTLVRGEVLKLRAAAIPGFAELPGGLAASWRRNGDDVKEGAEGAAPGGGVVSGSAVVITRSAPVELTIVHAQPSDAGTYSVVFANSCGQSESMPVEIKVKAHITDINADGQIDDADFILFLNQYDLMLCADALMPDACSADFNADGQVDDADFAIFVPAYSAMIT